MVCSQCGTKNPNAFAFCVECGSRLGGPGAGASESEPSAGGERPPAVGAAPRLAARLRVEHGSVDEREFEVDRAELTIGRRLGNDVVIHDTNVSRHHARIVRQDGGFAIEDTNSANGTFVNGERVDELRPLRHGDVIQIGDAEFLLEVTEQEVVDHVPAAPTEPDFQPDAPEPPSAAQLSDMAQAPAEPEWVAPAVAQDAGPTPGADGLEGARREAGELTRELVGSAERLRALAGRADQLERALGQAAAEVGGLAELVRGAEAYPLRELRAVLADAERVSDPNRLLPVVEVLEQLARQPRDIELLLALAQQAPVLTDLLHLHARLGSVGTGAGAALDRLLGDTRLEEPGAGPG